MTPAALPDLTPPLAITHPFRLYRVFLHNGNVVDHGQCILRNAKDMDEALDALDLYEGQGMLVSIWELAADGKTEDLRYTTDPKTGRYRTDEASINR